MSEIFIDPEEFQNLIDEYEKKIEDVKTIDNDIEIKNLKLKSIDNYLKCVQEYNEMMKVMCSHLDKELLGLKEIKDTWFGVDKEIAEKTFFEAFKEKIFG